jgi:hypothetical protein
MVKGLALAALLSILLSGCLAQSTTSPSSTYSEYELEYQLLDNFHDYFWCDPYLYPVAREDQEQEDAIQQFPQIRANSSEFTAILAYLSMDNKADYTDGQKLLIFRQHNLLRSAIEMAPIGSKGDRSFVLRVGRGQGERIKGTITATGEITLKEREPSVNTCPICLAKQTLIDTPAGAIPVEDVCQGMLVWTLDCGYNRVAAPVVITSTTAVPAPFQLVSLRLADGRALTASAGHPTAQGRTLGEYRVGDMLDGSLVVLVDLVPYHSPATYDIRPSGGSGVYWANGIPLRSTLAGGQ